MILINFLSEFSDEQSCKQKFKKFRDQVGVDCPKCGSRNQYIKNNDYTKPSEIHRCGWYGNDPLYIKYHDEEWGREVNDDHKMFEFLVLESSQAGLSWITSCADVRITGKLLPDLMSKKCRNLHPKMSSDLCKMQESFAIGIKFKARFPTHNFL